jgi:allantoinase
MTHALYPRDMIGYGRNPPDPRWPGGALLALNIVLNYEEGGESSVLHGDPGSVAFLTEHITTSVPQRVCTAGSPAAPAAPPA